MPEHPRRRAGQTQDTLAEILDQFKLIGDGDYLGRDGHKVQVRTAERQSLDTATVKGFLTPAQIIAASKTTTVITAKVV